MPEMVIAIGPVLGFPPESTNIGEVFRPKARAFPLSYIGSFTT